MSRIRKKASITTPLQMQSRIELPSNLLGPHLPRFKEEANHYEGAKVVPPKDFRELPIDSSPRAESIILPDKTIKNRALYKRLISLSSNNETLSKLSFGKLLSMMVVEAKKETEELSFLRHSEPYRIPKRSVQMHSIQCKFPKEEEPTWKHSRRYDSLDPYRTTRLFRQSYKSRESPIPQTMKGQKKESKRIHNFYTSQIFRKSLMRSTQESLGVSGERRAKRERMRH